MSRENVTDILCIGAQRAMTSWLHHVLAAHPGCVSFPNFEPVTSTSKEAHYWDWNHQRGRDWYRVLMRPLDDHRLSMDFTPEYAFLRTEQIAECQQLSPGAKVIYILRDPLARAVSAIRMHTLWATNNAGADQLRIGFDGAFLERCKAARLWDHGAYAANVARWRHHYPDMLLINYEDLRADPWAGLGKICTHLGLGLDALDEATRETLAVRAARHVWTVTPYPLTPDALHFLHGATWNDREAALNDLSLRFTEGAALLEAGP